jgi:hypothetical protein
MAICDDDAAINCFLPGAIGSYCNRGGKFLVNKMEAENWNRDVLQKSKESQQCWRP